MKHLIASLLIAAWPALADVPKPGTLAYFGLHFTDFSTEGAINGLRPDETARIAMAADFVAQDMRGRGYALIPTTPVAEQLAKVSNPARCNGCDVALARDLGAEFALTGEVHKVSNLILSLNLVLREVQTGKIIRAGSVDIRGNTDESWQRGFSYLLRNIIFRDQ